ncbi:MAG: hypothetical protein ACRC5C_05170, partial [Bacilli bacterium]
IHIYYAAVEGSTVNTVNSNFFRKFLRLERERVAKFTQYGVMDTYLAVRFNYYVQNWYFAKLRLVRPEQFDESVKLVEEILSLYRDYTSLMDEPIRDFIDAAAVEDEVRIRAAIEPKPKAKRL